MIDADPRDTRQDRPGRLAGRQVHGRADHECGGDVGDVADAARDFGRLVTNKNAESNAESGQHHERFDEAAKDRPLPLASIDGNHVRDDVAPTRWMWCRLADGGESAARSIRSDARRGGHSSSVRPVSRRKTSSKLERRTSQLSGSRPCSSARACAASPFSQPMITRSASRS